MRTKSRRATIRNLILTALALILIWYAVGCPVPAAALALRRVERQHMVAPSTILYTHEGSGCKTLVGITDRTIHMYTHAHPLPSVSPFRIIPRPRSTAVLIALPETDTAISTEDGIFYGADLSHLLVIDPPLMAKTARLTIDLAQPLGLHTTISTRTEDVFVFQLEAAHSPIPSGDVAFPYTLEFYDKDGNCISLVEHSGGAVQN